MWFTTLEDLTADPAPIARLLRLPPNATANASDPLFRLTLRPPSYRPDGLPQRFLDVYARARNELWTLNGRCFEKRADASTVGVALPHLQPNRSGASSDNSGKVEAFVASYRCAEAGLPATFVDPPSSGSAFEGAGPGTVGGDPAFRFLEQAQIREGSECWKLLKHRLAWKPTRLATS